MPKSKGKKPAKDGAGSAPFEAGDKKQVAVRVIHDRGNELLVVKALA